MNYYILTWGCDEGPDNAILFRALSYIDVCQHLLDNRDDEYAFIVGMAEKRSGKVKSAVELLDAIFDSYVDGDSFYKIALLERQPREA